MVNKHKTLKVKRTNIYKEIMDFSTLVKDWVKLDNEHKRLNDQLRELRSSKGDLSEKILTTAVENNYEDAIIQISDGRLAFKDKKETQPLTLKYIEQCLSECIGNPSSVESIMKYIKSNRQVKVSKDIRRFYNES